MKRLLGHIFLAGIASAGAVAAENRELPKFEELSGIVRSNLAGVTGAEIERAAAQGLLTHFKGRVILGNGKAATTNSTPSVSRSKVYDEAFAYVRVTRVEEGVAAKVSAAFDKLGAKRKLKGLVLDLRYATGGDYGAAGHVADLFLTAEQLLIDWGGGKASSTAKETALKLPVTVLVNGQTRGAAEALAGALRQSGAALIVGNNTAGEASMFKEFTLSDGQKLRIASGNVRLGNGETLSTKGLTPDIAVKVTAEEERAYFSDPFRDSGTDVAKATDANGKGGSTNQVRPRINEAELVRMQREGNLPDDDRPLVATTAKAGSATNTLRDPVLGRALDVLKAIAIVQPARTK